MITALGFDHKKTQQTSHLFSGIKGFKTQQFLYIKIDCGIVEVKGTKLHIGETLAKPKFQ